MKQCHEFSPPQRRRIQSILLYSPTYSPGWSGVLTLGDADDMCITCLQPFFKQLHGSYNCIYMALSTCSWVACMAGGIGAHRLIFWWRSRHAKRAVKPFRDFCTLLMPPPPKQHSQANPASYAGYSSVAPGTLNNCQESLLTG